MQPEDVLSKPEPLAIDPARVTLDHGGFARRHYFVRLPEGAIADDLKEPGLWRKVQRGGNALARHDAVYLVAFDETWVAEAIVAEADAKQAVLAKPRITQFPERFDKFFEDDMYRVKWVGNGYRVQRKHDGHLMTAVTANATLAERDLVNLYGRRA
ncbi:hypothetical protein ACSBOB_20385 [Mesorhizobium sp. ASY16-5R]|jgi:hypothetical protein|uniref:hypothetical protein n=1 Tax=Mesorhizobium sp. ASY16-5R TaxID=3445772 RepID=UPI003FA0CB95